MNGVVALLGVLSAWTASVSYAHPADPHGLADRLYAAVAADAPERGPFGLLVRFEAKPEHADALATLYARQAERARTEPGNLAYEVWRDASQPATFRLYQHWRDLEAFRAHEYADYTLELFRIGAPMIATEGRELRVLTPAAAAPVNVTGTYAVDFDQAEHVANPRFPGIATAALYGDAPQPGLVATHVHLADGAKTPVHTHPYDVTTVVTKGTAYIGTGPTFDESKLKAYPAGSFFVTPAGAPHFMFAKNGGYEILDHYEGPLMIEMVDDGDAPSIVPGAAITPINPMAADHGAHPTFVGASGAVLLGQRDSQDLYATHAKLEHGAVIPPHTHRNTLTTWVTSGTAYVGTGTAIDESKLIAYSAGTFFVTPAGSPHFIVAKDGPFSVLDHGVGPSDFVPADD